MEYELSHFDTSLLRFEADKDSAEPNYRISWADEHAMPLLPKGFEPYSEFYASDAAEAFGVEAVPYELHRWKGQLCSACKLFASLVQSFVPVASIVRDGCFHCN